MAQKTEYICTLSKELNNCPYFDGTQHCKSPETSCGMLRIQEADKKYVRKERWYEKYYKSNR